ncbi:hypothetical protein Ait01nite_026660 [Actinoplanes italicus]|uniref:Uncharacterized protein n=1 Tax=Actinoplanes italicus TaxID=113567 RepID=A0A2T0KF04_9ACTN|nr:hypothetical protein [Actinoplanes italicus]PRX21961.1 hypothetical protein CLV67_105138 [Actinoplanes italicus]GIE29621.1 hypothetical protein Ait01nite_026660 [Actinoplanes italicus]
MNWQTVLAQENYGGPTFMGLIFWAVILLGVVTPIVLAVRWFRSRSAARSPGETPYPLPYQEPPPGKQPPRQP